MTRKKTGKNAGKGPSQRMLRIGELIRHKIAELLTRGEIHDDVIASHSITIPEVRISPDMKLATVYVMPLGGNSIADVLAALHDELATPGLPVRDQPSKVWLATLAAELSGGEPDRIGATSDGRIDPRELIEQLVATLPPGAIVCCDAGENRIFMTHYFRSRGGGAFLQPSGTGGMGYATPGELFLPDRMTTARRTRCTTRPGPSTVMIRWAKSLCDT